MRLPVLAALAALALAAPAAAELLDLGGREVTVVTENASDFLPLLDERQAAGMPMTPVLVALTAGRGVAGTLHARLAEAIHEWAAANPRPYAHAHWLP